jgi:hypothetical protein
MATINQREVVDEIIAGNGRYGDEEDGYDPLCIRIVQYNNMFDGKIAYGLTYEHEDPNRYLTAPACLNPVIIWSHPSLGGNNGS